MIIQQRPPVTNLYTSAVFVGWGAIIVGIFIERLFKNKLGLLVSSIIGFLTLLIAHHLSLTGDTLEMMQAVLDTNFWLATHVVVITLGYSGTFLAGFLAIIYVIHIYIMVIYSFDNIIRRRTRTCHMCNIIYPLLFVH